MNPNNNICIDIMINKAKEQLIVWLLNLKILVGDYSVLSKPSRIGIIAITVMSY